jgi:hypothetical protein
MSRFHVKHRLRKRWLQGSWAEVRTHLVVSLVVSSTLFFAEPRTTLIVGGSLCLVSYAYLGIREARKATLWLSPLSFYFFWYCIGMGVSPLYLGLTVAPGDSIRFASDATTVSLQDLATGYVLYLLGSFALHLGMQRFRPLVRREAETAPSRNLLAWLAAVWVGGLLFQFSPASFSFLGATAKILSVAVVGSVCGFAVISRKTLGLSRYAYAAILMVGTAGLFFGNLASGSKAYIMFSFLPIFWLFIKNKRLRIWTPALALVLGMFYLGLVAPVVQTSRMSPLEEGENPRAHLLETFETWNREKPQELDHSFLADQLDQFVNRQFDAVPVGFMVGEVKESGLLLGETMKYASYAFIPRLIWPDKPSVTRGAWFSTRLGLFESEADATTSIGMTAVGELYWNFGTLGVLVGMFVIGCLQGILWRMAGADPRGKPIHMLLYVTIMLSMTDMPEAVTVVVSLAVTFLTFKAALVLIDLVHRRRNRGTSILRPQILHQ